MPQEKRLSVSPRLGGPGSAFKPYASNEDLFDPTNFRKTSDTRSIAVVSQNYPLRTGESTKLVDSRHSLKGQQVVQPQTGPVYHNKIKDLRENGKGSLFYHGHGAGNA